MLEDFYLTSPSGSYFAIVQKGNISVFKGPDPALNKGFEWNTGLPIIESGEYFVVLQGDGNICTYQGTPSNHNQKGNCLMTNGDSQNYFMVMQDDGNLDLYKGSGPSDNNGPVWSRFTKKLMLQN